MTAELQRLLQLPVRTEPFDVNTLDVIRSPKHQARSTLSMLTSIHVGLARLPRPNHRFVIAFASYDCSPPMVREVPTEHLIPLFPLKSSLLHNKNRPPSVSDRLYAHYYFATKHKSAKRLISKRISPSSTRPHFHACQETT